jgi:hypothetical protein
MESENDQTRDEIELTISNPNNLQRSMRFRDLSLAGYSQERKEHNHRTAASCKPEWTGYAIVVADKR